MAVKSTKCRVLVECRPNGVLYKPNQVVEFPTELVGPLKDQGAVDPSKGAVDYCVNELGVAPIVHAVPDVESSE